MPRRTFSALLVIVCSLAALLIVNGTLASPAPVVRANSVQSPEACITINTDVTTNTIWSADCYHVTTNTVAVQPGAILTIVPVTSTRVEFEAGARLLVIGNLQALGDPSHPITFTSAGVQASCAWQGIGVPINTEGIRLQYSTVEYACAGVTSNDADQMIIVSNTFRYLGDGGVFDGAIGGDTDNSTIANNTIYSSSNGIVLNESSGNFILHNTIYDIDGYGIGLIRQTTTGGNNNTVGDNIIYRARNGLRLEDGSGNQVLTNSLTLNTDGAIYLDRQGSTTVAYNHIYTNGGGAAYRGGIFITGTGSIPTVQGNVVLDGLSDAVAVDASAAINTSQYNALCATASNSYELRNNRSTNVNTPNNWWGTNAPISGVNYLNANVSDPIVLSITLGSARLPADASATTIVTVTLRDSLNNTVPAPNRAGDPNARHITLQTTLGSVNPLGVDVNDQGVATAVLSAAPQVGTGLITATAFCNYPLTATYEITNTNVAIAKTSPLTQTAVGSLVTYTIVYSNPSGIAAPNVVITDVLGANLAYVGDTSGYPANVVGNIVTWTIGTLPSGANRSFVLTATVPANAASCVPPISNTAQIGTSALESTYADNTATAAAINPLCAEWAIVKMAIPSSGPPAQPIDFMLVYTNNSTTLLSGAIITDQLPVNTLYISDTSGLPVVISGRWLTWTLPALAPGAARSFWLRVQYTGAVNNVILTNTACISGPLFDRDPSNNCSSAVYLVQSPVDVVVVKDDDVGPATPLSRSSGHKASAYSFMARAVLAPTAHRDFVYEGDVVTYTIAVVNVGTYTATNVVLTETLPLYTNYLGIDWMPLNSRTFITTLNSLAPGDGRIVYFVVRVQDPIPPGVSSLVNYVCGYSSDQDAHPDDNCHYEDTPVVVRPLRVSKSAPQCLAPGSDFNYTINFANLSNVAFSNVPITDTLPTYTTYTGSTGWSCAAGICTQIVPSLPPISNGTSILPVHLSSTFPYTTQAILTNTVVISGGYQFVLTSTVAGGPNLAVAKNDNVGPLPLNQQSKWRQLERRSVSAVHTPAYREFVLPGEWITYTILYVNTGIGTAHNVILTETLPLYTTYPGGDWTSVDGRHYTIALGDLAPGQGGLRYFSVKVAKPFPIGVDRVINRIDIGGREAECDVSDNWSADDTPVHNEQAKVFLPLIMNNQGQISRPRVSFTNPTYHVSEAVSTAVISVKLNMPWTQPVTVTYSTADGTATAGQDYTATSGSLVFAPGQVITTFSVGIISDTLREYWETVDLALSNPQNADLGQRDTATLYIDDIPCLVPSSTLISLYSPMAVAYDAPTDRLFIANRDGPQGGSLYTAIISPTPQITHIVTDVLSAQGVAQDSARHRLYVIGWNWLNVLNSDTYSVVATITLGSGINAHAVVYNPNNSKIYVSGYGDNSITIVDAGTLSVIARLTNSSDHPLLEPSYIALEPNTNKVYVTNHAHGRPSGWVTVVDGFTNQIAKTIYPSPGGELYGAAVDPVHGHVYIAAINTANIYVIDAATDAQLGSFQVRRWSDNQPVPLRMIAVNPNPGVGTKIRLWLTSSSTEDNGLDNVIALTGNWPNLESPALGADLPPSPERGIKFDPVNKYLFIASASANRVTILRDTPETQQCLWPFVEPHGPTRAGSLYVVVNQTTR